MKISFSRIRADWRQKLLFFDKLTLGYLILLPILILLSGKHVHLWPMIAIVHPILIIGVLALISNEAVLPGALRWLRDWYPMLFFTFFFGTIGRLVTLFFPFWLEPFLLKSDIWFFGEHPWEFFARHLTPLTTEIFSFAYWSYYFLIPLAVWVPYRAARARFAKKHAAAPPFDRVMARVCLTMFTCYACFLLMPARGPHHVMNLDHELLFAGGWFYNSILFIQGKGSVVGAAFPSSHVAAAWTVLLALRQSFRKLFWTLLPLVVVLSASTFVIQYHYVIDSVGGFLVAAVIEVLMSRREAQPQQPADVKAGIHETRAMIMEK